VKTRVSPCPLWLKAEASTTPLSQALKNEVPSSIDNLILYAIQCLAYTMQYTVERERVEPNHEVLENLRLELRRGCLILAVLAELRSERYGYTLRKGLADRGIEIDEGTLYPLLRRLESQGLLTSQWREEDKRNKRFYRLSKDGKIVLKQLAAEWDAISTALERILEA
jgi:PadR family transcriptional regulator, regulatory protein PadR